MSKTAMVKVESEDQLNAAIADNRGVLVYFSGPECNVCKVLRPKIEALCGEHFPKLPMYYVDCDAQREIAGQNRVFTIPVAMVFFDGREAVRKTRTFGMGELREAIERPYQMMYE